MGLYGLDRLTQLYEEIKNRSLFDCMSTLILCSFGDPDSLAACKLLCEQLKTDSILYRLVPVQDYSNLGQCNEDYIQNNDELRTIILLNVGGTFELAAHLEPSPKVKMYVFDSQRPLNLDNLYVNPNVRVVADRDHLDNGLSTAYRVVELGEFDADYDLLGIEHVDSDGADDDERADDPVYQIEKRNRSRALKQEVVDKSQALLSQHNNQAPHTHLPCAILMLKMIKTQTSLTGDMIWLGCLGLTHHKTAHSLNREVYDEHAEYVDGLLHHINVTKEIRPRRSTRNKDDGERSEARGTDQNGKHFRQKSQPYPSKKEHFPSTQPMEKLLNLGQVTSVPTLNLYNLRHWSLLHALRNTFPVITTLGLWTRAGRVKLANLLAKMGIPLAQANVPYDFMDLKIKKKLMDKFLAIDQEVKFDHGIFFKGWERNYGFDTTFPIRAVDACQGVLALFKVTPTLLSNLNQPLTNPRPDNFDTNLAIPDQSPPLAMPQDSLKKLNKRYRTFTQPADRFLDQFYTAYDALDDIHLLNAGIHLASHLQAHIVMLGMDVLIRTKLKRLPSFKLALLSASAGQNSRVSGTTGLDDPDSLRRVGKLVALASNRAVQRTAEPEPQLPILLAQPILHHPSFSNDPEGGTAMRLVAVDTSPTFGYDLAQIAADLGYLSAKQHHHLSFNTWDLVLDSNTLPRFIAQLSLTARPVH